MQQLHFVGFTADFNSLIFSSRKGAKSGGFTLPLNEELVTLVAEALRRRQESETGVEVPPEAASAVPGPRRQSLLSPREIQARLRAGRSTAQVAAEAGVEEDWVARFAAPVAAERSQVVSQTRQLRYAKPRRGPSAETLGTSVRWNLAERGVRLTNDEFDAGWSGYQVANHTWMVTFSFVSRKRAQLAQWEVELGQAELYARNRLASDLGYVEPGRRRRSFHSLLPEQPKAPPKPTERAAPPALSRPRLSDLRPGAGAPEPASQPAEPPMPSPNGAAEAAAPEPAKPTTAAKGSARTGSGRGIGKAAKAAKPAQAAVRAAKVTKTAKAAKATRVTKAAKTATKSTRAGKVLKATKATKAAKTATKSTRAGKVLKATKATRATKAVRSARSGGPGGRAERGAPGHTGNRRPATSTPLVTAKRPAAGRADGGSAPSRPAARTAGRARGATTPPARGVGGSTASRRRTAPAEEPPAAPAPSVRTELDKRKLEILRGEPAPGRTRSTSGRPQQMSRRGGTGSQQEPQPARRPGRGSPPAPAPEHAPAPAQGGTAHGGSGAAAAPDDGAEPRRTAAPPPADQAGSKSSSDEQPAQVWVMPTSTPSRPEREPQEGLDAARDSSWGDEADDAHLDVGGPDVAGSATVSARAAGDDAARQPVPGEPSADPQVLTIRARRATPPTGETEPEAELVLPPNRPPLRPAQPAAQPRRRRFGRANR